MVREKREEMERVRETGIEMEREGERETEKRQVNDNSSQTKSQRASSITRPSLTGGEARLEQMDCNCTQSVFRAQSLCPAGTIGGTLLSH